MESHRTVQHSLSIQCKSHRLIQAFVDPVLLKLWWNVDRALVVAETGGVYALCWNNGEQGIAYVSTGIIEQYDPSSKLVIDKFCYFHPQRSILGPMTLRVNAIQQHGYSDFTLSQEGYQNGGDWDWYYDAVQQAWPLVLHNFKSFMEERFAHSE